MGFRRLPVDANRFRSRDTLGGEWGKRPKKLLLLRKVVKAKQRGRRGETSSGKKDTGIGSKYPRLARVRRGKT